MPTPTEIIKPYLKYCQKRDIHCCCLSCKNIKRCNPCRKTFKKRGCEWSDNIENGDAPDRDPQRSPNRFRCYKPLDNLSSFDKI